MNLYSKSKSYYLLLSALMLLTPELSYTADILPTDTQSKMPNPNPITDPLPSNPDMPAPAEIVPPKMQDTTTPAPDTSANAKTQSADTTKDTKDLEMEPNALTPSEALDRLMAGNKRFVENKMVCPDRTQERRTATLKRQAPFAVIIGCSDSRVPPELAFDQGVGDIFVVRTAGNTASPIEVDSAEYSVRVNGSSLVLVLGHQNCGAIEAVYNGNDADIPDIKKLIRPTVAKVKELKNHSLEDAIIANIRTSMTRLKESPYIKKYIEQGKIRLQGGYYHLESGKVDILPEGIVP